MHPTITHHLVVDVDAEARPELRLGQLRVRVEVAVLPEVPRARPVPRRPTRVAHRHSEVAELALAEHAVSVLNGRNVISQFMLI